MYVHQVMVAEGRAQASGKELFQFQYLTVKHALFNPFPNKPRFLCVCSKSLLKTL